MGAALHTCADDEQGAIRLRGQLARGQQRNGGSAASGDGGAIQNQLALSRRSIKDDDIALNGGPARLCVAGREADELGHDHLSIGGRHAEQAVAGRSRHDDAWRNRHTGAALHLTQKCFYLVGQSRPRQ